MRAEALLSDRRTVFVGLAGIAGGALAAIVGITYTLLDAPADALSSVASTAICLATVLAWRATNGHRLVPHLGVAGMALTFSMSVLAGSIAYVGWLGLVIVLAFALLGMRGGLGWSAVIAVFLVVAFVVLESRVEAPSSGSLAVRLVRICTLVPALALIGFLYERQRTADVLALEQAMQARSRLLANVSHEMRTPLNGIIGTTQALQLSNLPDDAADKIETIQFSGETLLALINDLLDVSRAEAGKLELNAEPFDARRVVELSVETHAARAADRAHTIAIRLPPQSVPVVGDSVRFRQIVGNLIANAIRHGGPHVEVALEATAVDAATTRLRLTVHDDGAGIDVARRAELFQPFAQLNPKTAAGGSGLGLFISRTLARGLGGTLGLTDGPGTTFALELVLPRAESSALPVRGHQPLAMTGAGRRALVVDDNPVNLKVARALLEKIGLTVDTAESGEEALAVLENHLVDLVFMDLQMPGLDGMETTRRLHRAWHDLPVFALTASASNETRTECESAGMRGCLHKPVQLAELRAAVDSVAVSHAG